MKNVRFLLDVYLFEERVFPAEGFSVKGFFGVFAPRHTLSKVWHRVGEREVAVRCFCYVLMNVRLKGDGPGAI